ncbi:MAG: amidophosphoribosyltransferase [Eggerthellaceae bacterium]|nr:amidophosphoribosyltransferase [Eggerthellaceae bacterium]
MAGSIFPGEAPDRPQEECAVFGVFSTTDDVARLTAFGLQALQHRGQESAGIAVGDGETVTMTKDLGLVTQVFNESALSALSGRSAIGHCRYATSGHGDPWLSAQPHMSAIGEVLVALAHNGTLVDTNALRAELVSKGIQFRSPTDSEVACQAIGYYTRETQHLTQGIEATMKLLKGAYAMVLTSPTALYAFRDPHGIRPLCLGELPDGRGYVVSSETCGLDIVGATFVRDIKPGEIIRINEEGISTKQAVEPKEPRGCIFEYVYFARPDSIIDDQSVYQARRRMGAILARESGVDADLVIGVPDSGVPGALGYATESGIPFADAIVKNRYVGRTFIQPTQEMRQMGIRIKLNPLPELIKGKRLVVVDDSIVRGNTSKKLVEMLRAAGAKEVHMRIVSPEVTWPCFYGIDTPTREELISSHMTADDVCQFIGADSLTFISLDGLHEAVRNARHQTFCEACFTGDYFVPVPGIDANKDGASALDEEKLPAGCAVEKN